MTTTSCLGWNLSLSPNEFVEPALGHLCGENATTTRVGEVIVQVVQTSAENAQCVCIGDEVVCNCIGWDEIPHSPPAWMDIGEENPSIPPT